MSNTTSIEKSYELAKQRYAAMGVDADAALDNLAKIPVSLHCWQGDDVAGFESDEGLTGGGIQPTGNYPGRARTGDELREDIDKALSLIPGKKRLNLHAIYAETDGKRVGRDELQPEHFARWAEWAKSNGLGLDFNGSFFSHPLAADGFTLSSRNESTRKFWVDHGIASRKIGEYFGKTLGTPCVTNIWIPDGYKDIPVDRKSPRLRLKKSLDEILAEKIDPALNLDALEGKLFGIGSEAFVVGSHEFYLAYAAQKDILVCLDSGHYHPTERITDKISSVLTFLDQVLLHVSRGVRWDSDHVVLLSDELQEIAQEIIRGGYTDRVHIGLDFFDASINRVAAWVIGTRCMLKALLMALLEPYATLQSLEASDDLTSRLAMLEELKTLPFGAVWDYFCLKNNVPVGAEWIDSVKAHEKDVLSARK